MDRWLGVTVIMTRRRKESLVLDTVTDYGPSVTRDREGRLVSSGPGMVVMGNEEDIDVVLNSKARRPVIRVARRWDALRSLLKNVDGILTDDVITVPGYLAAERFLDDLSRAQGSSAASFTQIVVSGGGGRDAYTEGQRRAIQAVMKVRLMLGLNPDTVTWWVVLENKTPADFDAAFRLRHGTGAGWLRAALIALDEHYNGVSHRRRG